MVTVQDYILFRSYCCWFFQSEIDKQVQLQRMNIYKMTHREMARIHRPR